MDRWDLLGALPGDGDLVVAFVGCQGAVEAGGLAVGETVGEAFDAGVQEVADAVERVALASAVAVDLLLNPAPALVERGAGEFDDVEGVEHGDGVVELVVDRVLVALGID